MRQHGVQFEPTGVVERAYDEADALNLARVRNAKDMSYRTRYFPVTREVTPWEHVALVRKPHDSQEER